MNMSKLGFSTVHMYLLFAIAIFFVALIGMQFYKKQLEGLDNKDTEEDEEDEDEAEGLENKEGDEDDEEEDDDEKDN